MSEPFLELGIDLKENSSLNHCIKNISKSEILQDNDKFFCDIC